MGPLEWMSKTSSVSKIWEQQFLLLPYFAVPVICLNSSNVSPCIVFHLALKKSRHIQSLPGALLLAPLCTTVYSSLAVMDMSR